MTDIEEEYTIKCIQEYPMKRGYVAITLVSTRMLQDDEMGGVQMGIFPADMAPPREVMQGIQTMIQQTQRMQRHTCPHDHREIILIVSEIDFHMTEWCFGDTVSANFKKTKNGKDIEVGRE